MEDYELEIDGRPIQSNNIKKCAYCKTIITKENNSGWEAFVWKNFTQPICKKCEEEEMKGSKEAGSWVIDGDEAHWTPEKNIKE